RSSASGYPSGGRQVRDTMKPVRGTPPPGAPTPASSPSFHRQPRVSGASTVKSVGGTSLGSRFAPMEDLKMQLQQLKKETRDMKAVEAQLKFTMRREEDQQKLAVKREDIKGTMEWRQKQQEESLKCAAERQKSTVEAELVENKDFQEFKKIAKHVAANEDLQRTVDNYLDHKENSEWSAELHRQLHSERQKLEVEDHLEQTNFMAEYRLEEEQNYDIEERKDRLDAEYREMELKLLQAAKTREFALENLEHVRAHQHSVVPTKLLMPTLA
ncbi:unnamed protein product, partial [Polarella glacialis]